MKYLAVVCGLLLAGSVVANDAYFVGYVTIEADDKKQKTKASYVHRSDDMDHHVFELSVFPPEGEDGETFVISAMMKETDDRKVVAVYSADGKQRIGTGTAKGEDAFTLEFVMLYKGMAMGEVTLDMESDDDGDMPGLAIKVKIDGVMDIAIEGNLQFDLAKYMRCSSSDDPDC